MVDKVEIGNATLYLGDCREVIPTLALQGAVAMMFDPPYGIAHSSDGGPRGETPWEGQRSITGDDDTATRDWLIGWARERGIPVLCFGSRKAPRPRDPNTILVWDKGPASGGLGDLGIPWKDSWEEIYVFGSKADFSGSRDEGVLRGPKTLSWVSAGRVHPHEKPVWLSRYLASKLTAETVLVPTMGSGSEVLGALEAGKRVIGIEINSDWFETAKRRAARPLAAPMFV